MKHISDLESKKKDKYISPAAYTLSTNLKEFEFYLLKDKKIKCSKTVRLVEKSGKHETVDYIKFLRNMNFIIEDSNNDYILNTEFEDKDIKEYFDDFSKFDKIDFRLLYLYRMFITFPIYFETLKYYFKLIWLPVKAPEILNKILGLGLNTYIEKNKHSYPAGKITYTDRTLRGVIHPVFEYLGFLKFNSNYKMVIVDISLFERLLLRNLKQNKTKILKKIKFMENFLPIIEQQITGNSYQLYPIIQNTIQTLLNHDSSIIFTQEADSSRVNIPVKNNNNFTSHIEYKR